MSGIKAFGNHLSIVDGPGDGGRDVICSRGDIRIQLSVRKDWSNKINTEAAATLASGKRHFIYITNRRIRENEMALFLSQQYNKKGDVDLSVYDLDKVATTLSMPGAINSAYEALGLVFGRKINATAKDIALSNILLFSREAKEFRDNVIESNIKAQIFKSPSISEADLIVKVSDTIPGVDMHQQIRTAISRLCTQGAMSIKMGHFTLSHDSESAIAAAEKDYTQSVASDIARLQRNYLLTQEDADELIRITLEILARRSALDGDGICEVQLSQFIADKNLIRKKDNLYADLAKLTVARVSQFGEVLDHIFSANTFDIFRALGRNTSVSMVLDSSVAMPLMFGLSFVSVNSRYGIGAAALSELCKAHCLTISVPRCYLNEMANHGLKALEFADTYDLLGDEPKSILRASGNAYISHYSHVRDHGNLLQCPSLKDFLNYFGLAPGRTVRNIENRIESILDSLGINILPISRYEPSIRKEVAQQKEGENPIIIDHDAAVCTYLHDTTDAGFIFATWDNALIDLVEGLTRIYADTPARITDFLSMASGDHYESEQSYNLLGSLLYCDEKKAAALASKIEKIKSAEAAYEINKYTEESRKNIGEDISSDIILSDYFHVKYCG
jgi:hypothetical protein